MSRVIYFRPEKARQGDAVNGNRSMEKKRLPACLLLPWHGPKVMHVRTRTVFFHPWAVRKEERANGGGRHEWAPGRINEDTLLMHNLLTVPLLVV